MNYSETPLVELTCGTGRAYCPALGGLEIKVKSGEAVAVFGAPGTGKTLLLRMIAGLEPCMEGERICRAKRIGFVFQTGGLVSNLSIRDNVSLPLTYSRHSMVEAQRRSDIILERFGLKALQDERPAALSAEERRMSQLARAAALEVDLLLLDELFLRLSARNIASADEWLRGSREATGMAVLMVSLLESSVRSRVDRSIQLGAGNLSSVSTGGA